MSDSSPEAVTWTKIVLVGCPGAECGIKMTPDGRTCDMNGEPIPIERRPRICGEDGRWLLGKFFLCAVHAREVAELMGDDIDAIEAAWREECL